MQEQSRYEITVYVAENGDDGNDGSQNAPFESVNAALKTVAGKECDLAVIVIAGTITEIADNSGMVALRDQYPPLLFRGASDTRPGILDASGLERRVVFIGNDNTLTLGPNLAITGGNDPQGGSGVCVHDGRLILDGAVIAGNETHWGLSGGVYVEKRGDFVMHSGSVIGNTAYFNGGGVFPDDGGTFTMYGGRIAENQALVCGGGVFVGVDSAFTMYGGVIEANIAGGDTEVSMNGPDLPLLGNSGAVLLRCGKGGGVYVCDRAVFTMRNGDISNNHAVSTRTGNESGSGGGIFVQENGLCAIEGGTIQKNYARNFGGGIYTCGKAVLRNGSVSSNNADTGGGGGVYIDGKRGVFVMEHGRLLNNAGAEAGGVCIDLGGEFRMQNGIIADNTGSVATAVYVINGKTTLHGGTIRGLPNTDAPGVALSQKGTFLFAGGELNAKVTGTTPGTFQDLRNKP